MLLQRRAWLNTPSTQGRGGDGGSRGAGPSTILAGVDEKRERRIKAIVRGNFDVSARSYREFEVCFGLFGELASMLASMSGVGEGQRILDVGCGCGDSANVLSGIVGRRGLVVGLDVSRPMLLAAASDRGAGRVLLVQADGQDPSCVARGRFDVVLYNACAFLLPDPESSFARAALLLVPGGTVGVSVLRSLVDARTGQDLVATYRGDEALGLGDGRIVDPGAVPGMLSRAVGPVITRSHVREARADEARAFYRVPAQGASLYPRASLEERLRMVDALFAILDERGHAPALAWDLHVAQGGGIRASG